MLRAAFDETLADMQFLAEAKRFDLPVIGPIRGEEAAAIVKTIYAAPPALVARAREIVGR